MTLIKHDGTVSSALIFSDKGTVTQGTSNSTTVTLDTSCGVITLFADANSAMSFTLNNSLITTSSVILLTVILKASTAGNSATAAYEVPASGSIKIHIAAAELAGCEWRKVAFMVIN